MPGTASGIPKNEGGSEPTLAIHSAHRFRAEPAAARNARGSQARSDMSNFKNGLRFSETYAKLSHRHAWRCHLVWTYAAGLTPAELPALCSPHHSETHVCPKLHKGKRSRATED
jgi:hypothetical protein